jgi:hypothetical protein
MKKTLFFALFLSTHLVFSDVEEQSCFPKSNLKFSKALKSLDGMSEIEAKSLLGRIKTTMNSSVKAFSGKEVFFNVDWNDETVDAHASRDLKGNPVIFVNGGLVRHPDLTRDGLMLIACHELGHHLGGAPKILRGNSDLKSWSSAEGEADYFAVTKCLPRVFSDGLETKSLDNEVDTINLKLALTKCKDDLCTRIILAGKSVSDVFASLKIDHINPSINSIDKTIVDKTFYSHPNPQCRLDTYIAGARCDVNIDIPFDNNDPKIGACLQNSIGARPICWYHEADFTNQ